MSDFFQMHRLIFLMLASNVVGFAIYLGTSFYFLYRYYYLKRSCVNEWKCQPEIESSISIMLRDFILGSGILFMFSCFTACFIHYLVLNDFSRIYFDFSKYNIGVSLLWAVIYLLWLDFSLYWNHRLFHIPWLYNTMHYVHHRTRAPMSFNAFAIHPIEAITYWLLTFLPFFVIPMHYIFAIIMLIYTYYVSLADHSGIKFQPWFFGQSPSLFHDDHHVYFHVNYGQNFWFWDRIFGSWRRTNKIYGERVFETKEELMNISNHQHDYINYS